MGRARQRSDVAVSRTVGGAGRPPTPARMDFISLFGITMKAITECAISAHGNLVGTQLRAVVPDRGGDSGGGEELPQAVLALALPQIRAPRDRQQLAVALHRPRP